MYNKNQLKRYIRDYAEWNLRKDRHNKFICPFCNSGGNDSRDSDSAFSIKERESYFYCFSCHRSGDIYTLIGQIENLDDFRDQLERAEELYGRW